MNNAQNDYINSVNLNAGSDFPYLVLNVVNDQSYPRNPGFQVMHWHEDLQFIYVLDGEIELKTLDASVRADQGSGIFINKNVIHHVKETFPCRYNSFIFPDYFLKFYFGSPAAAFVEHIVGKDELPICCFPKDMDWCKSILSVLSRLADLENGKTAFYAYEVLCLLSALWLEVCRNLRLPSKKRRYRYGRSDAEIFTVHKRTLRRGYFSGRTCGACKCQQIGMPAVLQGKYADNPL